MWKATKQCLSLWVESLVLLLCILPICIGLITIDPPPALWRTEQITAVEVTYNYVQSRFSLSTGRRSPSSPGSSVTRSVKGYLLTDEEGNRYWLEGTDVHPREGERYTVTYSQDYFYRKLQGLTQGDTVYLDEAQQARLWMYDLPFYATLLLALVVLIVLLVRSVRKAKERQKILEYQEAAQKEQP